MKKIIALSIIALITIGSIFAINWSTIQFTDKFGDPTGAVGISTVVMIKGNAAYCYGENYCTIRIESGNSAIPYLISFNVGQCYSDWIISIKTSKGEVKTYAGAYDKYTGRIYPTDLSVSIEIINYMKETCSLVVEPINSYFGEIYNYGFVYISARDLSAVKGSTV